MFRSLAVLFTLTAALSACSVIEDSKEMKDTLGDLNRKGDQLAKRISDVEVEATFERSYTKFIEETERLFGENEKGRDSTADRGYDPDMVVYAKAAIQSLLFQFWKGDYSDTVAALDDRFTLHVDVFFARVNKHIPRDFGVNVMFPDRSYKGVGTLGAFLETVRPEYSEAVARAGLPPMSLYDVVVRALKGRDGNLSEGVLPQTHAKVLEWQQEAVYVLQLRQNFLPMLVLARMTDLQDRSDMGLFTKSKLGMMVWGHTVNLDHTNPQLRISNEQLLLWTEWLNNAAKTRQDLREAGFKPEFNTTMGKLLRAVDFGQKKILSQDAAAVAASRRGRIVRDFAEAYERVVREM